MCTIGAPPLPVSVELADLDLDVAAVPGGEEGGGRDAHELEEVLHGHEAPHHRVRHLRQGVQGEPGVHQGAWFESPAKFLSFQ